MKLKEMTGVYVQINSIEDKEALVDIFSKGKWSTWMPSTRYFPFWRQVNNKEYWSSGDPSIDRDSDSVITLAEFKKEQGIMKYKIDDVLIGEDKAARVVLGICGKAYLISSIDNFGRGGWFYTEEILDEKGWRVKEEVKKPQQIKKTVSELEEDLGMEKGSLNVTAEK